MFGPQRMPRKDPTLPQRVVTPVQFEAIALAAGWPADKVAMQLTVAKTLGSWLQVGQEYLQVKEAADGDRSAE